LGAANHGAPFAVPLPDEVGIGVERRLRGELGGIEIAPVAAGPAESGDAALGGDAGAGNDEDAHVSARPEGRAYFLGSARAMYWAGAGSAAMPTPRPANRPRRPPTQNTTYSRPPTS